MDFTSITTSLSNLKIIDIVGFVLVMTAVRFTLIKLQGVAARAIVEIVEVILIVGVFIFLIVQPFFVKAFYIPSGSMRPGLVVNDHILVNRLVYRFHGPEHNDIVVFKAPPQALETGGEPAGSDFNYIKRLIGVPGDTIQVVGGTITIAGNVYTHNEVRSYYKLLSDPSTAGIASIDEQHLKFLNDGIDVYDGTKWTKYPASDVAKRINGSADAPIKISPGYVIRNGKRMDEPYIAEDPDYNMRLLPNGQVLTTEFSDGSTKLNGDLLSPDQIAQMSKKPLGKVPPGEVIVMGDNRNDSNDSTHWGPLTDDNLVGRTVFLFYPFNRIRIIK
jgi:signal peptidase I